MAKCVLCNSKKGQRQCKLWSALVCSLCCGQRRQGELCQGCVYYKESKIIRNYGVVPRFSTVTMEADLDLQSISNSIESAICLWDHSLKGTLKDDSALRVLERLLDHYYFKEAVEITEESIRIGYEIVLAGIKNDLSDIADEVIIKILSVIYFVAKRRAKGGHDYFDVIHKYVGLRAGPGIRILGG
jgi:ribosomal protein L32